METTSPNNAADDTPDINLDDEADFICDLLKDEMLGRKSGHPAGTYLMRGATLTSFLLELGTTYSIHPIIISS